MDQNDKTKLGSSLNTVFTALIPFIQKVTGNRFTLASVFALLAATADLIIESTAALGPAGEAAVMGLAVGLATILSGLKKED